MAGVFMLSASSTASLTTWREAKPPLWKAFLSLLLSFFSIPREVVGCRLYAAQSLCLKAF